MATITGIRPTPTAIHQDGLSRALEIIRRAERAGSPATQEIVGHRLGVGKAALTRYICELRELGKIIVDEKRRPRTLHAVEVRA